jgi:hypothetical protein
MTRKQRLILIGVIVMAAMLAGLDAKTAPQARAEPEIYASPVHAGCYLERIDRCKIHVEPFTIYIAPDQKLVQFRLVAARAGSGTQTVIYDFRPDQSNPLPISGSTITPTLVAQDFAAHCGETYTISLQGQDTGDRDLLNLGTTAEFTCPQGTYSLHLPVIRK